uniref:Sperm acrosome membrane-associated protein 1 isoform X2 n=1 Tax=Petromyzon marinus TaxID=7757 RepID=A0AAJ7SLC6_PETMA|nr:sperm acrosome membrane-associated protein 1 isoform X2 [Petromyzon marinus]
MGLLFLAGLFLLAQGYNVTLTARGPGLAVRYFSQGCPAYKRRCLASIQPCTAPQRHCGWGETKRVRGGGELRCLSAQPVSSFTFTWRRMRAEWRPAEPPTPQEYPETLAHSGGAMPTEEAGMGVVLQCDTSRKGSEGEMQGVYVGSIAYYIADPGHVEAPPPSLLALLAVGGAILVTCLWWAGPRAFIAISSPLHRLARDGGDDVRGV